MQRQHLPPHDLSITVSHSNGHIVLRASGDVDLASKDQLSECLRSAIDQSGAVTIDMRDVTFMDSSGLTALVQAARRAAQLGERLVVRSPHANVQRVMAISGVDQVVTITDDASAELDV